jgi:hypothetical protein
MIAQAEARDGVIVRHVSRDWIGRVTADPHGLYWTRAFGDAQVRVTWLAGTALDGATIAGCDSWVGASEITLPRGSHPVPCLLCVYLRWGGAVSAYPMCRDNEACYAHAVTGRWQECPCLGC